MRKGSGSMSAAANLQVQTLFIKSAEDEHTLTFAVRDAVFEFHANNDREAAESMAVCAGSRGAEDTFVYEASYAA